MIKSGQTSTLYKTLVQFVGILRPADRFRLGQILGIMIAATAFEAASLASLRPVLTLIVTGELPVTVRNWLAPLTGWLGFWEGGSSLLLFASVVGLFTTKTILQILGNWKQARFSTLVNETLSVAIVRRYMAQPWIFHTENNSTKLFNAAITECNVLTAACSSVLAALVELVTAIAIVAILFHVEPYGAILVGGAFCVATMFFLSLSARRVRLWASLRQLKETQRHRDLDHLLHAAKDLLVLGRSEFFISRYQASTDGLMRVWTRQQFVSQLPRLWYESIGLCVMGGLCALLFFRGQPPAELIPTLGIFAAAAFRLLPSATRMLAALQVVRGAAVAVETIRSELMGGAKGFNEAYAGQSKQLFLKSGVKDRIEVRNVTWRYPNSQYPALQDVSLALPGGSTVALIGPSGSGKSTLADVVLGLIVPEEGDVMVGGRSITADLVSWRSRIGYVPQTIYLSDDTVKQNIAFGLDDCDIDDDRLWACAEAAQLIDVIDRLPDKIYTRVGERGVRLSGGQRQRIGFARALYHDPAVLVLDEATSALDHETEGFIMEAIRRLHGTRTILIISHRLASLSACDFVLRLEAGRVVEFGEANEVLAGGRRGDPRAAAD